MNIHQWWPSLGAQTRSWLIQHNGEPLPPQVIADISAAVGGQVDPDCWAGQLEDGPHFSDEAVDWIEAVANHENPTTE